MGFFKEHTHRDGTKSTDWGGSIVGGMGGAVGFSMLAIVAMIVQFWELALIFIVIALISWGLLKLYSISDESGKRRVVSMALAIYGGCLGLNNFYNKRYITGFIKLFLFSIAFIFTHGTVLYAAIIALVITGWIEASIYFFGKSESKTTKTTSKIIIAIFFILVTVVSINEYGQWYQINENQTLNNIVNYDEIRDRVTTENFQKVYDDNYQKSLSVIKEYNNNPISNFFPSLKYAYSIEGLSAYKEIYGNDFKISADDFEGTIDRLGKLDKGYSEKLAQLITDYMDKDIIIFFNEENIDIEDMLKENNQISGLRAYLKLKKSYNLK